MPEEPIVPAIVVDDGLDAEAVRADVATQPEDDDPLALAGDPAEPPEDSGRPEGVGP